MSQSYHSPLAIAAEETLVRVRLEHGCTGVGSVIDPSADGADLAPGSTLDIPLWLASSLAQRGMARVDLPVYYGNKMRRKMRAGAGCEDLRVRCPHYYTVAGGLHAAMLASKTADEGLPDFIMATFRTRYKVERGGGAPVWRWVWVGGRAAQWPQRCCSEVPLGCS